jgi:hypothetical protein
MSSSLVTDTLTELAATLTDLKDRVRVALAGELARVVADAVRDTLQTVLRREPGGAVPSSVPTARSWHPPGDPWADDQSGWEPGSSLPNDPAGAVRTGGAGFDPTAAVALAAGAGVAQWWARRTGRLAAAAGFGVAVAVFGSFGPTGRAALAVLAAATDLLAVPDLLTAAAGRLGGR